MRTLLPLAVALVTACAAHRSVVETTRAMPSPEELERHCAEVIGAPRVVQVTDDIWVALGYDLANTTLIRTEAGNVVIDPGMSPDRARPARDALLAASPGPIHTVIFTHSHIDHVGGASVWVEAETRVWATDAFVEHFFEQYGQFFGAESARGGRQFGRHVSLASLGCSAIGRRPDLEAALENGAMMPTHTFSGATRLDIGGLTIELVEAHGETHDQLFVWLDGPAVLLPGDNWYRAFPNLYTLRGTKARPVDDWIASLDEMRRRDPEVLVPSHTPPVQGRDEVRTELRDYRDAIQWVRDEVVRGANDGVDIDTLAADIGLPEHLADRQATRELYGQIDWSVRAIYGAELGWFDGRPATVYTLPPDEVARRTVTLMGGDEQVLALARAAREDDGDLLWSLHLLTLLDAAGTPLDIDGDVSGVLEALAQTTANTNGRAYLLESAFERREGVQPLGEPQYSDDFLAAIPLRLVFDVMQTRLMPEASMEVVESVVLRFEDTDEQVVITVRRGVAEVVWGEALPGTPAPLATVTTDGMTWRRLALGVEGPLAAISSGRMKVKGDLMGFRAFFGRFNRGVT